MPGRPVSLDLLLVANYVIPVHQQVFDVVRPGGGHCAAAHRRPRIGPGLVGHVQLGRGDLSGFGGSYLAADVSGGGRPGALEHLLAVHHDLDRPPALLGEHRGYRLQIGSDLSAEAAAYFRGHYLDRGFRNTHDGGR